MPTDDLEVVPSGDSRDKGVNSMVFNQTNNFNQFIQLVNSHSQLPDGQQLASYTPEDREWIKRRMELEQDHRHGLINKVTDDQQSFNLRAAQLTHQNSLWRFLGGVAIILFSLGLGGLLLYLKTGWIALGIPAIVLSAPVSTSIGNFINDKLKSFSKNTEVAAPNQQPK